MGGGGFYSEGGWWLFLIRNQGEEASLSLSRTLSEKETTSLSLWRDAVFSPDKEDSITSMHLPQAAKEPWHLNIM